MTQFLDAISGPQYLSVGKRPVKQLQFSCVIAETTGEKAGFTIKE
jgi:hypothetical protein